MPYSSFARARRFGRQLVGPVVGVYLAGVVSAVVLAAVLLLPPVLVELLATRGTLAVPIQQSTAVDALGIEPSSARAETALYVERGLLPTVWRLRDTAVGPLLSGLYSRWPALQSNTSSLAILIGVGWLLAIAAAASLYWLETTVKQAAVETTGALRRQIHAQAHRLGSCDLFLGQCDTAAELFFDKAEAIRGGLVSWWRAFPHAVVLVLLILWLAIGVNVWLALVTLLLAILTFRLFQDVRSRQRRRVTLEADRVEKSGAVLKEHLRQNREMGNLSMHEHFETELFEENLRRFHAALLERETAATAVGPLVTLLVLGGTGLILLLAGFNVLRDPAPRLTLADVTLLASALAASAYPVIRFERLLEHLPPADAVSRDLFAYLDREPKIGQVSGASPLEKLSRQVTLENVALTDAAGRTLLDDVSLSLPAESQTVIFSSSEEPPIEIAGLLARFCDPTFGRVLFDGRDLRQATLDSVRRQVMVILPEHVLISGTLAENIVGDDRHFPSEEIVEALKLVHAYELIQPLPEGLETIVGPHGLTLSAGQIIRLALARVVLRKPSVLVIEEPRDELDQVTAERVADALARVSTGRTLVILARRLATLRAAQRIALVHECRIVAEGTHQELLQQNELYRHLNYVRFNEFRGKLR